MARGEWYWPRDLLPSAAPAARILTYGYEQNLDHPLGRTTSQSTIYDLGWDFLMSLAAQRHAHPDRPLCFIAHSLGGIVAKETLRRSRACDIYRKDLHRIYLSTVGVIFFGTPHGGIDPGGPLHRFAKLIRKKSGGKISRRAIRSSLPTLERLRELRDEFTPIVHERSWIIYSFQEEYGTRVLGNKKVCEIFATVLSNC